MVGGVASSKVEFRYLQLGGVFSGGGCSKQQGGVKLSPTGWCFQRVCVCVASSKVEFHYLQH